MITHSHLIEMGIFPDDKSQYLLPIFPTDKINKQIMLRFADIEMDSNQNILEIPFSDSRKMRWLLHLKSYILYLSHTPEQADLLNASVITDVNHFYSPFISRNIDMDPNDYNDIVQKMLLQLTTIFEKENFSEKKAKQVIKLYDTIASQHQRYSKETIRHLFKILIGLADYAATDNSAFGGCASVVSSLFNTMFWILSLSNDQFNWDLFNKITPQWPFCSYFVEEWMVYFNCCLDAFKVNKEMHFAEFHIPFKPTPDEALELIVNMMKNGSVLQDSKNSKILTQVYGVISDMVSQQQARISDYFYMKWYSDDIFELFSSCQKLCFGSNEDSLLSSLIILSRNKIRPNSPWMKCLLDSVKEKLQNPNTNSINEIIKQSNNLICAHPFAIYDIIDSLIECIYSTIKSKSIEYDNPIILSLLLSLSEISSSTDKISSIVDIVNAYTSLNPIDSNSNWQFLLFLHIMTENTDNILKYLSLIMKSVPPHEYFSYLLFISHFYPKILNSKEFQPFLVHLISNCFSRDKFASELPLYLLAYFISELNDTSEFFKLESEERKLIVNLVNQTTIKTEKDLGAILDYILMYSTTNSNQISPKKAQEMTNKAKEKSYYQINNAILTLINQNPGKIICIVRHFVGIFAFEVTDEGYKEGHEEDLPQPTNFEQESSNKEMFEIEEDFTELTNLLNNKIELNFTPSTPHLQVPHPKFFSFLAGTGLLDAKNDHNVKELNYSEICHFLEIYDQIPIKDEIAVDVIHCTPLHLVPPGTPKMSKDFKEFLDLFGRPSDHDTFGRSRIYETKSMNIVYRYMTESNSFEIANKMMIVYNETDFDCIEGTFQKLSPQIILSVKKIENNLYRIDLIKTDRKSRSHLPIIYRIPRLVSKQNIAATISCFVFVASVSFWREFVGRSTKRRMEALSSIFVSDEDKFTFLRCALENKQ
ncbi:hypothetical protein TVAG_489580 [Trichomonas vaginalis G3]|uniref:Uncharacterized protein n=1 Tax=Trichomonas vaginalis (strain ATCC PRA-98 / G3) TaxID=412133 RepID=A2FEJ4_TRIV3|nr:hypothetical protein TVAGG3_0878140 [Trichomonas vaginalis G3]EAX96676.1 hypothetical protein TVAG_489580 [Trichomonas vaginalis G3]KAI5501839.1 hypothetical protein TVAGG3_0878140 [Trichomonas vaginalis G3]|eukprot:XP_001309606.1 hypothetical protein [Trichomonas vaginalis G3]